MERRPDIHMVLDNYGTHTHPKVQAWFAAHPRYHLHFTPTGASWLNPVERWFAEIIRKRIRRGTFHSVTEQAIRLRLDASQVPDRIPTANIPKWLPTNTRHPSHLL